MKDTDAFDMMIEFDKKLTKIINKYLKNNDFTVLAILIWYLFILHFCKNNGLFTLYSQNTLSYSIHIGMDSITSIPDLLINQIPKI